MIIIMKFNRENNKDIKTARSQASQSGSQTNRSDIPESARSTMSTSRVQTALAALSAEKISLESKLLEIEAALEDEKRKQLRRLKR